jgi:hypothetical protein
LLAALRFLFFIVVRAFIGILQINVFADPYSENRRTGVGVACIFGIFAAKVCGPADGACAGHRGEPHYELILPLIITAVSALVFTIIKGKRPLYDTIMKRTMEQSGK